MREIWKDIQGFEGLYSISNRGNVKRVKTEKKPGTGNYAREEHILKQRVSNVGYKMVDLFKNNIRYQYLVHRLVATAFVENKNPNKYNIVNHIDENKQNNNFENLEWCTQKINLSTGSVPFRIGLKNSKSVIQMDKRGAFVKKYSSIIQAERETGISNGSIGECLHFRRKTAGGYLWKYAI